MADFNVRSDSVNVEQLMEQIRGRIREKRGVDYTEQQIQELATAQLEKLLDPQKVRSNLLEEFRRMKAAGDAPEPLSEVADDSALFETHRGWLRGIRRLLRPVLKLFINTQGLAALSTQAQAEAARRSRDRLLFEVMHNLVVETTRLGIEVKNLKMRLESMSGRLDFNERRARALEGVVMYQPMSQPSRGELPSTPTERPLPPARSAGPMPAQGPGPAVSHDRMGQGGAQGVSGEGPGQRSRRRRRRRGRRGGGPPTGLAGAGPSVPLGPREHGPDESDETDETHETTTQGPSGEPASATTQKSADLPESSQEGSDIEPQ
jgi:hypothetical protein